MESGEQQPTETGTSSTDSLPSSPTQEEMAQATLRDQLATDANLTKLTRMIGAKSLHRSLKNEDGAVAASIRSCETEMFGDKAEAEQPDDAGEDGMEIMAARDVHIHAPAPASPQQVKPDQQTTAEPFLLRKAAPLVVALALGSAGVGGAGLGIWLNSLLNAPETPPPAVQEQELPEYPLPPGYGLSL